MTARTTRTALVLSTLLLWSRHTAAGEDLRRTFAVRHLLPDDAVMAVQVRIPGVSQDCHLKAEVARDVQTAGLKGVIVASCSSTAILAKVEAAIAAVDVAPPTQRFHVAVLEASRNEGSIPDLPPSEAKALADFRKVMTYKGFRIEAETVVQSDRGVQARLSEAYVLEMQISPGGSGDGMEIRHFMLRAASPRAAANGAESTPTFIETSFSIRKGETVVLGTSVSDQQARVVLVTALP